MNLSLLKQPAIRDRLKHLVYRHEELEALLADASLANDSNRLMALSREYAELSEWVHLLHDYEHIEEEYQALEAMILQEKDHEVLALVKEEYAVLSERAEALEQQLLVGLLPRDPLDHLNVFLEVRAGTGGDEAAIFSGDLLRMYLRYFERQGFSTEILSSNEGEHGGYKEIVLRVQGDRVYSLLKYESGVHRVQRVPATEAQGRVHTSACTVAILPEFEKVEEIDINPNDLRIDTYRASGAGGQHVNKTDSAIRITHVPTGLVVECQDERSQHKNRSRAMSLLQSKLLEREREAHRSKQDETRRLQVGSGDRSERIRTYNFPQNRLTDHRINLTLYQLDAVMEGALDAVIGPLLEAERSEKLAELGRG